MLVHSLRLLSKLPLPWLHGLSAVLYHLNRLVFRYRYDVVRATLERALPELAPAERDRLRDDVFRNLAGVVAETVKSPALGREELERRMTPDPDPGAAALLEAGRPAIFLSAHLGNWEWLALRASFGLAGKLWMPYQPLHDGRVDAYMRESRARFGGVLIPEKSFAGHIAAHRDEQASVTFLVDQCPGPDERCIWVRLFGCDTPFNGNLDRLARLLRLPVVFAWARRTRPGHYAISLELIAEPPYPRDGRVVVEAYARALEKAIRAHPETWLWTHRRWKLDRAAHDAPRPVRGAEGDCRGCG